MTIRAIVDTVSVAGETPRRVTPSSGVFSASLGITPTGATPGGAVAQLWVRDDLGNEFPITTLEDSAENLRAYELIGFDSGLPAGSVYWWKVIEVVDAIATVTLFYTA